jgi:hypothetical protein
LGPIFFTTNLAHSSQLSQSRNNFFSFSTILITALSPWFFRYWTFLYWANNFKTKGGLGYSRSFDEFNLPTLTMSTIVIDNGECLSKEDSIRKIEEIVDFFGDGEA